MDKGPKMLEALKKNGNLDKYGVATTVSDRQRRATVHRDRALRGRSIYT